jgi:hypothetical protein
MILVLTAPGTDFLSLRPCYTSSVPVGLSDKRQCERQFLDLKEHKKCLRYTLHKLRCQHLKRRIRSVKWGGRRLGNKELGRMGKEATVA